MKKILYINLGFYQYDDLIIKKLEKKGYSIIEYNDDPRVGDLMQLAKKIDRRVYTDYLNRKKEKLIEFLLNNIFEIDIVLVIEGRNLSEAFLSKLRTLYPMAKFILYLWDDIKRIPNVLKLVKYYDFVFSFDKNDCEKYNFIFLPLFYNGEPEAHGLSKYQLSCVCTEHTDRIKVLDLYREYCEQHGISYCFYLVRTKLSFIKNYYNDSKHHRDYVHTNSLSLIENYDLMKQSYAVLDICHNNQNGLTMRMFEALACGCKVITTNSAVKDYDFYSKRNIVVTNRDRIIIPSDFWNTQFDDSIFSTLSNYSLDKWIDALLNCRT